ncbi:hypothetical protein NIIDMKKI_54650 [Mycobacterium kansasii]|uniref:Helix-turn-helix domain-containing protein n=2 Tax=Mycobacteriaceae TaxID=1762 RepID=A0A7G1IKE5_MYCKA|nr:hypothetical protein NIIDMKKI_54650 [Mycobacterium kansasii]
MSFGSCKDSLSRNRFHKDTGSILTGPLTYDLAEAAERIGGVSEKWLAAQLRAGKLQGRKVGRKWRMTLGDIESAVEMFRVVPQDVSAEQYQPGEVKSSGLTQTSRRRFAS